MTTPVKNGLVTERQVTHAYKTRASHLGKGETHWSGFMVDTSSPTKIKLVEALRLIADVLELDESTPSQVPSDTPMTVTQVCEVRPVTPGWIRSHVTSCGEGPRRCRMYRLSDVDQVLTSSPTRPRPRKCVSDNSDPLDAMLASGELVRGSR